MLTSWNPDRTLLAPSPSLLAVNRELPSLLNLRIVSRSLSLRPDVLAAAGNNLITLRRRVAQSPPQTVVVELMPDHLDGFLHFDAWIAAECPEPRILVVGAALKYCREHLLQAATSRLSMAAPGNPIQTLVGLTEDDAHGYLSPSEPELRRQPLWEKRRLAVGLGCPAGCSLCPRHEDEGTATTLRSVEAVFDEIELKIRRFGVRDVEIVGAAWAGDGQWAIRFLEERIRRGTEVRLRLVLTVDQLRRDLLKLLVPAGCTRLVIRAGPDSPDIDGALTRALGDLSDRGRIVLVCPVRPLGEPATSAAARVNALVNATRAHYVHALLHTPADVPPACSELGRLADFAPVELHLGWTQRMNPPVRAWAEQFRDALASPG
ncbi:MAG: hypothetical protein ACRD26_12845 [Vicinamibacterales bacterium]